MAFPFTERANKAFVLAEQEARRLGQPYIDTAHLLMGLLKEDSGIASAALKNVGLKLEKMRLETAKLLARESALPKKLEPTTLTDLAVSYANMEARTNGDKCIGTEHLLLGILDIEEDSTARKLLKNLGVAVQNIRKEVLNYLKVPKAQLCFCNCCGEQFEMEGRIPAMFIGAVAFGDAIDQTKTVRYLLCQKCSQNIVSKFKC